MTDLYDNWVVRWQHENYLLQMIFMAFVLPTLVAGFGWGDFRVRAHAAGEACADRNVSQGGYFFAAVARLVFVHHSTFCVNSVAHYFGDVRESLALLFGTTSPPLQPAVHVRRRAHPP